MQKVKSRFTLKTAREMKRYTQEEAAKLIGVSVDTLGNYERGKSYPDVPVLRKIEDVYGVPYEQLIFFTLGLRQNRKYYLRARREREKTWQEERAWKG